MAGIAAIAVLANFFIIDWPPGANPTASGDAHGAAEGAITMPQLLKTPRFYGLLFAYIASSTGSVVITAHMVPMMSTWRFSPTQAATLLSVQSFVGIAGTVVFGWIADRIGGARALTLVGLNAAVLWVILLVHPPFAAAVVLIGLIGLHGAGAVPAISVGLSEHFGREGFSRAYGLANLLNLPFSVICVPAAAMIFASTGSYNGAIIGVAVFLAFAGFAALSVGRKQPAVQ
jgi:MFS family permease